MSEQALKDAKMIALETMNTQLQQTLTGISSQLRARIQCSQELFDANNNLRSSNILLEDCIKKLQGDIHAMTERVNVLETEKAELLERIDILSHINQDAA